MKPAEDLLHFIWRYQLFERRALRTLLGEPLQIQAAGRAHRNAGPDFQFASIRIGPVTWVGHIEIHVDAGDWYAHGHHKDAAYENVILHVVWNANRSIRYANGQPIPTLCLRDYTDEGLLQHYQALQRTTRWIPCAGLLKPEMFQGKMGFFTGLALLRLQQKACYYELLLEKYRGDWEKVFFISLARSFGFSVNAEAFDTLAQLVSLRLLAKYRMESDRIDAIFFGQAGMLNLQATELDDPYIRRLQGEYAYLKNLHKLPEMPFMQWKFLRMRPYNFPTFRLAQLAACYKFQQGLFSEIIHSHSINNLKKIINSGNIHDFWKFHFTFAHKSKQPHATHLAPAALRHFLINVVSQLTFAYGQRYKLAHLCEFALELLEGLPAEDNRIVGGYKALGFPCQVAAESQALLYLKEQYCDRKRCLHCQIGFEILNSRAHGT